MSGFFYVPRLLSRISFWDAIEKFAINFDPLKLLAI